MKILIVEDEIKAAKELERILRSLRNDIQIIGTIDSVEDGIEYLSQNTSPDLIFSDIQLADGMCFDIYKKVPPKSPIIFCTAFNEYLMDAFETNAVSYILKPITVEKVEMALVKFEQMKTVFSPIHTSGIIEALTKQLNNSYKTGLLVNQGEKIIPLQTRDISYFYLDNNTVKISTLNNQTYTISYNLDELEQALDPQLFYRANRQYIINKNVIINVERYFSRKLVAKLNVKVSEPIVISKARASHFLRWLEGGLN